MESVTGIAVVFACAVLSGARITTPGVFALSTFSRYSANNPVLASLVTSDDFSRLTLTPRQPRLAPYVARSVHANPVNVMTTSLTVHLFALASVLWSNGVGGATSASARTTVPVSVSVDSALAILVTKDDFSRLVLTSSSITASLTAHGVRVAEQSARSGAAAVSNYPAMEDAVRQSTLSAAMVRITFAVQDVSDILCGADDLTVLMKMTDARRATGREGKDLILKPVSPRLCATFARSFHRLKDSH